MSSEETAAKNDGLLEVGDVLYMEHSLRRITITQVSKTRAYFAMGRMPSGAVLPSFISRTPITGTIRYGRKNGIYSNYFYKETPELKEQFEHWEMRQHISQANLNKLSHKTLSAILQLIDNDPKECKY